MVPGRTQMFMSPVHWSPSFSFFYEQFFLSTFLNLSMEEMRWLHHLRTIFLSHKTKQPFFMELILMEIFFSFFYWINRKFFIKNFINLKKKVFFENPERMKSCYLYKLEEFHKDFYWYLSWRKNSKIRLTPQEVTRGQSINLEWNSKLITID